ncbi:hypothetical protein ACUN24_07995 [Pedobacter sp. WC2501]|uniref:hypothetical protein n=1 Tax=Pedobacter sp. WC2501 TaxID=3461400 RepID=UPI0040453C29
MQRKIVLLAVPPKPDRSGSGLSTILLFFYCVLACFTGFIGRNGERGCTNLKASAPDFQKKDNIIGESFILYAHTHFKPKSSIYKFYILIKCCQSEVKFMA